MSSAFKNTSTFPNNLTGSIRRGQLAIGVNGNLGPSSTTGWYNGPNFTSGKYQIITNGSPADPPQVFCPKDDNELIQFARTQGATGANTGSVAAVLAWIAGTGTLTAANFQYENIVTDGLVLNLDAGFVASYPTTGTSWYDWSGNANNGTLTNGPTFNSANSGSIVFDGVDDYINLPNGLLTGTGDFTIIQWVQSNGSSVGTTFGNYPAGNLQFGWSQNYVFLWLNNASAYASTSNFTTAITMIAGRRIGTTTNYLKNGVVISTGASSDTIGTSSTNFRMGLLTTGGETYTGNIYTTLVYNRGLSNNEILQNYNAQKGRFGL